MSRGRKRRTRQTSESSTRPNSRQQRRSETRRSLEMNHDEPVIAQKREPYRPDPVSEELVPAEAVVARRFKSTGAECNLCGWRTRKPGFNGRQAVRAHMKVHANRRRAYSRPVLRQSVALMIVALGLLAAYFVRVELEMGVVHIPVGAIASAATLSAMSVVIGIALLWALNTAQATYSRTAIRTARMINLATTIVVIAIGTFWVVGSPRPHYYGLIAPVILMAINILVAGEIGVAVHGARSGKWRSSEYSNLVSPKDEDAEYEYAEWRYRLIHAVRDRRINMRQLRGIELRVVRAWLESRRLAEAKRNRRRQRRPRDQRRS